MANETHHFTKAAQDIASWVSSFHAQFETDGVWESGNPDERGVTDQLMLKLKLAVASFKAKFTNQTEEGQVGYDYSIRFEHLPAGANMPVKYHLFLQAKNFLGKDDAFRVEFSKGRNDGLLQAQKLHATIANAIAANTDANTRINGGYVLYGPTGIGILYIPIGRVKELWSIYYQPAISSKKIDEAITEVLIGHGHPTITQFETVLTDNTAVPAVNPWL